MQLSLWDRWRRPGPKHVLLVAGIAIVAVLSLTSSFSATTAQHPLMGRLRAFRLRSEPADTTASRKRAVRDAMQFVWTNYHTHAFGADEITPLDGKPNNNWGNIGCMILDSMDTLWVMDLKEEFEQARVWVRDELSFENMGEVSVFETIIRSVGGLLSAYDLSGERVFLTKAVELVDRLLPAINEETGRAYHTFDTRTNARLKPGGLAESGTYQLEFEYLSRATGDPKYAKIAEKLYLYLLEHKTIQRDGLFANEIYVLDRDRDREPRWLTLTLGSGADSFYEYLLKVWILQGQPEHAITKGMFLAAVDGMEKLLLETSTSGRKYLVEYNLARDWGLKRMKHLVCFVPGWLALGAKTLKHENPRRSAHFMEIATELMETCYKDLYEKQPTKLSPEYVEGPDLQAPRDGGWGAAFVLRPEVVESLYVMYQVTGDSMYQEWGWQIFQAIDRNCRTPFGFAQYTDVTVPVKWSENPEIREAQRTRLLDNKMETFFAAETLKYLYLLFDPNNAHVSLDTHVFNTEAHPLSSTHLARTFNH